MPFKWNLFADLLEKGEKNLKMKSLPVQIYESALVLWSVIDRCTAAKQSDFCYLDCIRMPYFFSTNNKHTIRYYIELYIVFLVEYRFQIKKQ